MKKTNSSGKVKQLSGLITFVFILSIIILAVDIYDVITDVNYSIDNIAGSLSGFLFMFILYMMVVREYKLFVNKIAIISLNIIFVIGLLMSSNAHITVSIYFLVLIFALVAGKMKRSKKE